MGNSERRIKRKYLLILDELAIIASAILAIYFRYGDFSQIDLWQKNMYDILIIIEALLYALVFHVRYHLKRKPFITEQDPVDGLISVFKTQTVMFVIIGVLLFAAKFIQRLSRLVLGYMFVMNIVLDYIFRMIWRRRLMKEHKKAVVDNKVILVADMKDVVNLIRRHKIAMSDNEEIAGVIIYDLDGDANDLPDEIEGVKVISGRSGMFSSGDIKLLAESNCNVQVLFLPVEDDEAVFKKIIEQYTVLGFDVHVELTYFGDRINKNMIRSISDQATVFFTSMHEKTGILDTDFAVTSLGSAVMFIKNNVDVLRGKYICFSNVHTTVMAKENEDYRHVQKEAAIIFPDGKPIAVMQKIKGYTDAERVGGPDFMEYMFRATMDGKCTHYFYGSDEKTISQLKVRLEEKYPGIRIAGLYSPPYRELTPEEDEEDIRRINESGADIIWIGLGAPKQENWMFAHKDKINGVMLGVGAGFNFHAGTIKRAPVWMQKISLEWLYRLTQDPRRLLSRYFVTNTKFLWYVLPDLLTKDKDD